MTNKIELFHLQQAIRNFFNKDGFMDVLTPPIVENPGMEVHIHPFAIHSVHQNKTHELYLHTSPEFHMKELLQEGLEKVFTMSYCFRDEPNSSTHRKQFVMLEWYRANENYKKIMEDTINLYQFCHAHLKSKGVRVIDLDDKIKKVTVQEIFLEVLNIDILELIDRDNLYSLIDQKFSRITLSGNRDDYAWDDLFFLLMYNYIEPEMEKYSFLLLYEFPSPLRALSTIKENDPRVCERFEVYCRGIEICNCFNELTDSSEQSFRFKKDAKLKGELYGYSLPWPNRFLSKLEIGLPKSAGIALGVERLLMSLTGMEEDAFYD
ncbi:EF-P lysine aminoacylase EpmA [Bacteriovorax sp. BAL6_X]|uniref:EF-P lysine aminoacylase EpmA n=1 Tax=Bacteriovorax sp. BAL6_X TaxID=1201290 RepID=UPI00059112A9|nr:EF-P lysine aminoacylase EpmA [Bacteriovorax sp. BAL6_X]